MTERSKTNEDYYPINNNRTGSDFDTFANDVKSETS